MNYTSINDAFHFTTTMPEKSKLTYAIYKNCIYCNYEDTMSLLPEGTFRKCLNNSCRKQFQAKLIASKPIEAPTIVNKRHPNDYIFNQQPQLMSQFQQDQRYYPDPTLANSFQQFSNPNYDSQIRK